MSQMKRSWLAAPLLALLCLQAASTARSAEAAERLDLTAWEELPVLESGRIMPLQTYALTVVDKICGRSNPRFDLKHELNSDVYNSPELAKARAMFPGDKPRKFTASELLLSWLVERDAWEHVPFILAEHQDLRKLLDVPLENDRGERIRYVSPAQLAQSDTFRERLMELRDQDRAARSEMKEFKPEGTDKLVAELWQAVSTYRQIIAEPYQDVRSRSHFLAKASATLEAWATMSEGLAPFRQHGASHNLEQIASQLDASRKAIAETARNGEFEIAQIEPAVVVFVAASAELEEHMAGLKQQMLENKPDQWSKDKLDKLVTVLTQLSSRAKTLAKSAQQMHLALFDDADSLKVVPALNAAALERHRDAEDDAQPWLSLQVVLHGSQQLLKDYPIEQVDRVRHWFARMSTAYVERNDPDRAAKFEESSRMFADAVQALASRIEPLRRALPIESPDEDLMRYTQYPEPGTTRAEVVYNNLDPFTWSAAISLAAVAFFALAFGVLRKPMIWAAIAVLLLCIAWTVYGFYLRVLITQWAPVTNMYETVVYVPLFVSALGAWFLLLPATWNGLKAAWRISALPQTFEAAPLSEVESNLMSPQRWQLAGFLALLPRVLLMGGVFWALTIADYYDGGHTVLSLTPKVGFLQLFSNFNALLVWVVGMLVLGLSTWYIPRVLIMIVAAPAIIAWDVKSRSGEVAEAIYSRKPFGLAAALVASILFLLAASAPSILDPGFRPLMPVLRSNFWLTIHVLTIVSSYGAGLLAWGLGMLALTYYLFGSYRVPGATASVPQGYGAARDGDSEVTLTPRPPKQCDTLAAYCYKAVQVAVLLLAAGTILGGLWADVSWGRFWGWDPKEVFALVSLLVYVAVLHGRYAGLFGNFGLAFGAVLGATAIVMSWYGVNFVLGVGLHSYGFGQGGQFEVGFAVVLNWLYLGLASLRYWSATQPVTVRRSAHEPATVEG